MVSLVKTCLVVQFCWLIPYSKTSLLLFSGILDWIDAEPSVRLQVFHYIFCIASKMMPKMHNWAHDFACKLLETENITNVLALHPISTLTWSCYETKAAMFRHQVTDATKTWVAQWSCVVGCMHAAWPEQPWNVFVRVATITSLV